MTPETATIGRLVDTKTLFLEYRKKLQDVYTDMKMSKSPFQIDLNYYSHMLMKNIKKRWKNSTKFGLTVNEDLQLVGEPNVVKSAIEAARESTKEQLRDYVKTSDYKQTR